MAARLLLCLALPLLTQGLYLRTDGVGHIDTRHSGDRLKSAHEDTRRSLHFHDVAHDDDDDDSDSPVHQHHPGELPDNEEPDKRPFSRRPAETDESIEEADDNVDENAYRATEDFDEEQSLHRRSAEAEESTEEDPDNGGAFNYKNILGEPNDSDDEEDRSLNRRSAAAVKVTEEEEEEEKEEEEEEEKDDDQDEDSVSFRLPPFRAYPPRPNHDPGHSNSIPVSKDINSRNPFLPGTKPEHHDFLHHFLPRSHDTDFPDLPFQSTLSDYPFSSWSGPEDSVEDWQHFLRRRQNGVPRAHESGFNAEGNFLLPLVHPLAFADEEQY